MTSLLPSIPVNDTASDEVTVKVAFGDYQDLSAPANRLQLTHLSCVYDNTPQAGCLLSLYNILPAPTEMDPEATTDTLLGQWPITTKTPFEVLNTQGFISDVVSGLKAVLDDPGGSINGYVNMVVHPI